MKYFVAVTDNQWFRFLAERQPDEVNFWRPSGRSQLRAIDVGAPYLFKLHSPLNFIAGGGFLVRHSILPLSLAWKVFGEKNGSSDFDELLQSILKGMDYDPYRTLVFSHSYSYIQDRLYEWQLHPKPYHQHIQARLGAFLFSSRLQQQPLSLVLCLHPILG